MERIITYCGQAMKVACDERCDKAWGINSRPRVEHDPNEPDDYSFLADGELAEAPEDPGTYEGNDAKPVNKEGIPNRWCIRECERCAKSDPGRSHLPLDLPDLSVRLANMPHRHNTPTN